MSSEIQINQVWGLIMKQFFEEIWLYMHGSEHLKSIRLLEEFLKIKIKKCLIIIGLNMYSTCMCIYMIVNVGNGLTVTYTGLSQIDIYLI